MSGPRAISMIALAGTAALAVLFRHALPLTMAVHWGADGLPNGFASRDVAISIIPGIAAILSAVLSVLPRAAGTAKLRNPHSSYEKIAAAILLTLFGAQALIISRNLGVPIDVARLSLAGVGTLIAVIGNYFGKLPPNSAFGLRNRWTLASDEIWRKVHRLTGIIMFAGGAILSLAALVAPEGEETTVALTSILVLVAIIPPIAALALSALAAQRTQ